MTQKNKPYDLCVIGGGITGAGIARDAAMRGLSVLLFEKNTFGSGTSSRSSKLIHGGIRYLELASRAFLGGRWGESAKSFRFVLASLREARILERIAPDLVRPMELALPIYQKGSRSPLWIYAGCVLYGILALLSGHRYFPRILPDARAVLKRIPSLRPERLVGGVIIQERLVDDERLVLATVASARSAGAEAHEHTAVTRYRRSEGEKIFEITVQKEGRSTAFSARALVDATGAWIDRTRGLGDEGGRPWITPVAGSHIEIPAFLPLSVLLEAEDGRLFFVVRRGERCRVGTTERLETDPDGVRPTEEEVNYLLRSLDRYFPGRETKGEKILQKDAGVRPLPACETRPLGSIPREHEIRRGPHGALHIIGVKLTDHRRAAQKVVDLVARDLAASDGISPAPCRTATVPL